MRLQRLTLSLETKIEGLMDVNGKMQQMVDTMINNNNSQNNGCSKQNEDVGARQTPQFNMTQENFQQAGHPPGYFECRQAANSEWLNAELMRTRVEAMEAKMAMTIRESENRIMQLMVNLNIQQSIQHSIQQQTAMSFSMQENMKSCHSRLANMEGKFGRKEHQEEIRNITQGKNPLITTKVNKNEAWNAQHKDKIKIDRKNK